MRKFLLIVTGLLFVLTSYASDYTKLVVFGDSLSDAGNLYALTGQPPAPYNQRVTNELVWPEYLSPKLGITFNPGDDVALAGSLTNTTNVNSSEAASIPGVQQQIDNYIATNPTLDPNALYVLWEGANNLLEVTPDMAEADITAIIFAAIGDIKNHLTSLNVAGAKNLLVIGLPSLGITPRVNVNGAAASESANKLSATFNGFLQTTLVSQEFPVHYMDAATVLTHITTNPAQYGIDNVTDACLDSAAGTLCSNPESYLFWDDLHPTATVHKIIADEVYAIVKKARFTGDDNTLSLPLVQVEESYYDVSLSFNPATSTLQLLSATPTTTTNRFAPVASFDQQTGLLNLPEVYIKSTDGTDNINTATLELVPSGSYEFSLKSFQ